MGSFSFFYLHDGCVFLAFDSFGRKRGRLRGEGSVDFVKKMRGDRVSWREFSNVERKSEAESWAKREARGEEGFEEEGSFDSIQDERVSWAG